MQQDLYPSVKDLQLAYSRSTFGRYEILLPNIHYLHNEMDLFGFRKGSGFSDEIEIKLSKSDFLADFKKTTSIKTDREDGWGGYHHESISKHDAIKQGLHPCNYFSFLLTEELVDKCDIPSYAGLYVLTHWNGSIGYVNEVKKPPRLHKRKLSGETKYEIAKKAVFKCWNMMRDAKNEMV